MTLRPSFFRAAPRRAILESLLVGLLLWAIFLPLHNAFTSTPSQALIILIASSLPVCLCTIRLTPQPGKWWQQCLTEGLIICYTSCLLGVLDTFCSFLLIGRFSSYLWTPFYKFPLYIISGIIANAMLFIALRGSIRLLLLWNHLRRTQLLWSLTHAHVMLVALAAGLMILLIEGIFIINSLSFPRSSNISLLLPVTIVLVVLSIIALVAVIPPSVLFSSIVMRKTTSRIKSLATATSALRQGNYRVRVPVVGEDEVAQLQADFNAMATTLEQTMQQLRTERDTVSGLLLANRQLVATVSHELRTPVATLRSYLETTLLHRETNLPPTLQHDLRVMENEVIRLQGLIEDLFTLSRASVGKLTLRCEPTDIGLLVRRLVDARAILAWQSSRVEVVAHISPVLPYALVDAARMEQVLQNLLHNAVRHTPPGGIVAVVVAANENELVLEVKDTGEGISPADLPHIWERFYQGNGTRQSGGAGLGLALVKELVEAMHGTISVASAPGTGTCFTIHLPQASATTPIISGVYEPAKVGTDLSCPCNIPPTISSAHEPGEQKEEVPEQPPLDVLKSPPSDVSMQTFQSIQR